jgi:outer membrane protein assembly factor BamB
VSPGAAAPDVSEDTGYAPSTVATDGSHVAAIFVNGDIVCYDFAGKLAWTKRLGVPEDAYGHASSLAVFGSGLIVQFDQGADPTEGKSALYALDFATGKTVWQVKRPVQASWSTPLLAQVGTKTELITCANPCVIAYNPASGTEIWRVSCLTGDVAPSAALGSGFVFACNQGATLAAIRPGGSGDVTKSAIAWTCGDNLPDIVSPLAAGGFVYLATSEGALTCLDARTGKQMWQKQYEAGLRASPILDGKSICLLDYAGVLHFIAISPAFHENAKLELGEESKATPAIAGGRLFVRGKDHLFCLGAAR